MAKILIAAGGTGGHIYPALAIAEEILRQSPESTVEFAGTAHGLENKIIPAKGYRLHHLPIGRLNSNVPLSERLKTVLLMPWALLKSYLLVRRASPDFVLGVGGYATGPVLLLAAWLKRPTAVWEPNAMPGMANRILAPYVDECWVVFDEAKSHLKNRHLVQAGMPVRREIENPPEGPARTDGLFHVLVFGGSQGARGINTAVAGMMKLDPEWAKGLKLVHQTGPSDFARVQEAYGGSLPDGVELTEYLNDMDRRYFWADLVICRSGTGTLSELAACGKAAILIPFPFASDDHQKKNAESLVQKGAAEMIVQNDLTPQSLQAAVERLRADPAMRQAMSQRIRGFHQPRAAAHLAAMILQRAGASASR